MNATLLILIAIPVLGIVACLFLQEFLERRKFLTRRGYTASCRRRLVIDTGKVVYDPQRLQIIHENAAALDRDFFSEFEKKPVNIYSLTYILSGAGLGSKGWRRQNPQFVGAWTIPDMVGTENRIVLTTSINWPATVVYCLVISPSIVLNRWNTLWLLFALLPFFFDFTMRASFLKAATSQELKTGVEQPHQRPLLRIRG